jgi:hypothetical protein
MMSQLTAPGTSFSAPPGPGGPRADSRDGALRQRMMLPRSDAAGRWRRLGLVAVKTVHTMAFFSIGSCLGYLAYSGLARRSDRRAVIAGAVVTGEALVYAGNGFRLPVDRPGRTAGIQAHFGCRHLPAALAGIASAADHRADLRRSAGAAREKPHRIAPCGSRDVPHAKRLKLAKQVTRRSVRNRRPTARCVGRLTA